MKLYAGSVPANTTETGLRAAFAACLATLLLAFSVGCGGNSVQPGLGENATPGSPDRVSFSVDSLDADCIPVQGQFDTFGLYQGANDRQVGSGTLAISGNLLVVTVTVDAALSLDQTSLYVGTTAPDGTSSSKYPYQHKPGKVTSDSFSVNLDSVLQPGGGTFEAHAGDHLFIAATANTKGGSATGWHDDSRDPLGNNRWKSCFEIDLPPCVPAPGGVSATSGTLYNRIQLSWQAVTGATSYELYRAGSAAGPYSLLASTTGTTYTDSGAGITYWYRVRAVLPGGSGAASAPVSGSATSLAPTASLSASAGTYYGLIQINWAPVSGAQNYTVFRSSGAAGPFTALATTSDTWYSDYVDGSATYYYKVRANAAAVTGELSATVSGNAAADCILPAPGNVQATDGVYSDRVRITWDPVLGARHYYVYFSLTQAGPYTLMRDVTTTTADNAIGGTTAYWYKVRAVNGSCESPLSAADSGWAVVPVPRGVAATDGTLPYVQVTWNAVSGATSYEVFRSTASDGPLVSLGTTSLRSFNDNTGTTQVYYYRIKTIRPDGPSAYSAFDTGFAAP